MLSLTLGVAGFAAILSVLAVKRERFEREGRERERLREQEYLERMRREQARRDRIEQERRKLLDKKMPLMRYIPAQPDSHYTRGDGHVDIYWVTSDLPDLPLEEHRAGCYICMMDFEEPRRLEDVQGNDSETEQMSEVPEPIRLLTCGHAYHRSCVDPWLLNNSQECPYCRKYIRF